MAQTTLKPISDFIEEARPSQQKPLSLMNGRRFLLGGLVVAVLIAFLLSVAVGSVSIPLEDVARVLAGGEASKDTWTTIILNFRLPRALTAFLAGAALGVSGLMMQTFFRNPLADPYILGISSGASLGVALVVLSFGVGGGTLLAGVNMAGDISLAAAASIGAGLAMCIVLLIARQTDSNMTLLILGLMFGQMTYALVSLLLYFAIPERIQAYLNWTFGSFGGVSWAQLRIFAPTVLVALGLTIVLSKSLNALLLGEQYAHSLGLDINKTRAGIIITTALLAGTVTAFCGPIGFVGVAVPHLCRSIFNTADHGVLIPATTLMGALVALCAGFIAEWPGSQIILPLNAVTALLGAPVVMWVVLRGRHLRRAVAV